MDISTKAQTQPEADTLEGSRILIVDDSPRTSDALALILSSEGFNVAVAGDGSTAVEMIAADPPDLVLLDVMMPEIDGFTTLEHLRSEPATAELPVILITALDQPAYVVRGLDSGANDFLSKPPIPEVLVARVRTQLRLKRLQDQHHRLDMIKDKFLQIAAHDLKNPLSNMMTGVEIIAAYSDRVRETIPEFDQVIHILRGAAKAMQAIIDDFLDHDALRDGVLRLHPQPVAMNDLVSDVVAQFKSYAEKKSIPIEVDLFPGLPVAQADPARLTQVVSNLIGNALKFTRPGAAVTVHTRLVDNRVRVEIKDTGPGIPKEEMPMLFQEFVRLKNRPTGGEKSSGLGLAISRQLVELHGGRIGAESTLGQGSLFWFEIPIQ